MRCGMLVHITHHPQGRKTIVFSVDDRGGLESQKSLLSVFFTLGVMAIVRLAYKLNDGVNVIDLAQGLSLTERRLVRQKQVFTIMGGMLADGVRTATDDNGRLIYADSAIKISTAPNNFYTRNAVTRGFQAWKKSRAKALEAAGEGADLIVGKYADFKVYLDETPASDYRLPISAASIPLGGGEWDRAVIFPENSPTSGSKELMIVGNHHSARYSLSYGWLSTRAKPTVDPEGTDLNGDHVPDVAVDFLATMFQDSNEDTMRINRIEDENQIRPFPTEDLMTVNRNYSTSEPENLQLQYFCDPQQNDLQHSIPGFQALCGLIRVDVGNDYSNPILVIDVETKGWSF